MSAGDNTGTLTASELLGRFVFSKQHVRQDETIRPGAFMPPTDLQLSVTRHVGRTETDLWSRGEAVASASERRLVGRADITVGAVRRVKPLDAVQAGLPEDLLHAHVVGWPPMDNKPAQKMLAVDLAAAASYGSAPRGVP